MRGVATSIAPAAAYIHLPFCRRRCHYCDFPIQVVGSKPGAADVAAERYCKLLRREVLATPAGAPSTHPLRSLYFGGGTPSLTPPPLLADVINLMRERYGLSRACEVTLEMDPGTFDAQRLDEFLAAGVTRVSVGVQSFDDALLTGAGRAHSLADAEDALRLLMDAQARKDSPLRSVSIDLIGGLPHQTRTSWRRSLELAGSCGAQHVSVYDLQIEPRTAYGKWFEPGDAPLPSEEEAAEMFRDASDVLGVAGFERYEVSSFARRPEARSQHNAAYWRNEPFYAFGLGATSHLRSVRLARPRKMGEYESFVAELESSSFDAVQASKGEAEVGTEALTTGLMLALRTREGVTFPELAETFGEELSDATRSACVDAAAELPSEWVDGGAMPVRFALSEPEGMLFSNEVISTIFAKLDDRLEEGS